MGRIGDDNQFPKMRREILNSDYFKTRKPIKNMKITTWNLQHGGGKRINSIITSLKENIDTDLFILTEFRNNSGSELIKRELIESGYTCLYTVDCPPTVNSVLIASKTEFSSTSFEELEEHKNRIIKLENSSFTIYGCYFPLNEHKRKVFEFLLNEIDKNTTKNIIITGDYNTGKHFQDEKGATFIDSGYLNKFEEKGLIDVWRNLNPDKKEYSWYSSAGNGFRLDHFYIHSQLNDQVVNCYYEHKYRENKISDHSMMSLVMSKR